VLIVGVALGSAVRSARLQRQAVAAILSAEGSAIYDWQYTKGYLDSSARPGWPEWLVAWVGEDYFGHVIWVELPPIDFDDQLADDDQNARMDAALVQIGHLSQVKFLRIEQNSRARDAMLADLKRLNRLTMLKLAYTKITDLGFVRSMASLEDLSLQGSPVGDAALAHLGGLTRLRILGLESTNVTDAGFAHLKGLVSLQHLGLSYTGVTDAGLVHLKGLTGLYGLGLSNTEVTDAGLVHLRGLTGLHVLSLHNTRVTDAGVQSLKTALPILAVFR
jgi:hypothetical protein